MAIFRFFKMAAAAILDFENFEFLTVGAVEPRLIYNNFSIFSKMAAVRHLGFVMGVGGTIHEGHLVVFTTVQNLAGIDAVVLIICTFFDFASLA